MQWKKFTQNATTKNDHSFKNLYIFLNNTIPSFVPYILYLAMYNVHFLMSYKNIRDF